MSSDFFFEEWKKSLKDLEELVNLDVHYQTLKAHEKKRCDASLRLSSVLGRYMVLYNQMTECLQQNLQVQKTCYIQEVIRAVTARILELKHELKKLDASEYYFLNNGLIYNKMTPKDTELVDIPDKIERPRPIQNIIETIFETVKERNRKIEEQKLQEENDDQQHIDDNWWDEEGNQQEAGTPAETKEEEISEEQLERNFNIQIIQAHEKTRQVIQMNTQYLNKRRRWEMELDGAMIPKAPYEIRERSAAIIQKACRAYFECKRKIFSECRRDELLGLRKCTKPINNSQCESEKTQLEKSLLKQQFEDECTKHYKSIKDMYLHRKGDEISEDYRDHIRDWFYLWFEKVKAFHDIPKEKTGGSKLIIKEELPTPEEWIELYKAYLADKKSKKNKSALQLKYEKMEAKRQEKMEKNKDKANLKLENQLKMKMMKNPNLHPGFNYPESEKTERILKVIQEYYNDWGELDETESPEIKRRYSKEVNKNKAIMEVKMDITPTVDEDMRVELKKLKAALKIDYMNNEEEMPEMKEETKRKGRKKKGVLKTTLSENIAEKMEELVFHGFIREYPKTILEDFIGDPNFSGDDIRCNYMPALHLHGDTRSIWWENCRELAHGFHKILLVGPKGSGKTVLLHVLASLNDAILFELDASKFRSELITDIYLEQMVKNLVSCAKAAQPSVIHIKHVHRLYYKKVPAEEADMKLDIFKRYFTNKLFKKIHKTDYITVVGSCVDPWVTKSSQMLKHFTNVVLLPNTTYSTVVQMLNEWVLSNHVLPTDLNVSCLARALQGYTFGYLKRFLTNFLSGERIARISARGLSLKEVYDSVLEDDEEKIDYDKYLKWYADRTPWGQKEKKHLADQLEFRQALEKWALKMEMEKQKGKAAMPKKAV